MKQPWDITWWLRTADFWFERALCAWEPADTVAAIRHYNDALNEVLL